MKLYTLSFVIFFWFGCTENQEESNLDLGDATTFVLCEGNFGSGNSALWSLSPFDSSSLTQILSGSVLGDVAQSLTLVGDKLFVVVNNSHKIKILSVENEISVEGEINFSNASPRYLVADDSTGYVSCWNLNVILVLDINSNMVTETISVPGMPEFLILEGATLYASIPNNSDWTPANLVIEISTLTKSVSMMHEVISGPGDMELIGTYLFVASTYYDNNFSTHTALSKIDLSSGTVTSFQDGNNSLVRSDLVVVGETLYRSTSTGLAPVNNDLSLDFDNIIGGQSNIYSAAADENYLFFGSTDYVAPDTVFVTDHLGTKVSQFILGAIPGDFITKSN